MVSLLDISGLTFFSSIFTFILAFVIIYAAMEYTDTLGQNKSIHALIAFSISVLLMFAGDLISIINFIVPWFVLLFIFILLILMAVQMFGVKSEQVTHWFMNKEEGTTVVYWIISIAAIILLLGISNTYGQKVGPYLNENQTSVSNTADSIRGTGEVATGDFQQNLGATLFHPRILGLILIMLIAMFTILLIAREGK